MVALVVLQLWMSLRGPGDTALLYGHWQSCKEADGLYAERVVDFKKGQWGVDKAFELHLGPASEFTIERGVVMDYHREHRAPWTWTLGNWQTAKPLHVRVRELGLTLDVRRAGGSRNDCESFIVKLEKTQ